MNFVTLFRFVMLSVIMLECYVYILLYYIILFLAWFYILVLLY